MSDAIPLARTCSPGRRRGDLEFAVAVLLAVIAVLAAGAGESPGPIEVSDDGRLTARPGPGGAAVTHRGADAPFGTSPDWSNTLRRQVGGLQVADVNGDGWPDIVAVCYRSNSFPPYEDWRNLIYFNDGGEIEADPSWVSDDEVSTGDVQVGDIDGDGHLDVFAANGGFAMDDSVIYFGSPAGPSTAPGWTSNEPMNAWNNYALLTDLDEDGDLDVFTANQGNSPDDPHRPMFGFINAGGVLETVPSWQSAESSIQNFLAAGDLDGDGAADLAVSKWIGFESGVLRNVGGLPQTTPIWTTGDEGDDKGIAWADVDGDGDQDLALGHDSTQLFRNDAGVPVETWTSGVAFHGHSDLRFADVDGDGDQDLAEIHFSDGKTHVYLNRGGTLDSTPVWTFDASEVGTAIAFGDLDLDGRLDLVVGTSGNVSLRVFMNVLAANCPGNGDDDGQVGASDLLGLLAAWGTDDPTWDLVPEGGDGAVDTADLLALLTLWGPCP